MFSQFKIYIYIVVAVIMLGMAGTIYYLYDDNKDLAADKATLEAANTLLEGEKKALQDKLDKAQTSVLELSIQSTKNQIEANKANKELENAKSRNNIVLAKPTLIEKMANKATEKVFKEIECLTGDCK